MTGLLVDFSCNVELKNKAVGLVVSNDINLEIGMTNTYVSIYESTLEELLIGFLKNMILAQ